MSKYSQEDREDLAFLMVMFKHDLITYDEMIDYVRQILISAQVKEGVCS